MLIASAAATAAAALASWLDGFVPWAQVAASMGRPVPDLIGFWAA